MSTAEEQVRTQLKNAPPQVQGVASSSFFVAITSLAFAVELAAQGLVSWRGALIYGGWIAGLIWFAGTKVVFRSKFWYSGLALFSFWHFLDRLARAIHWLRLTVEGNEASAHRDHYLGVSGVIQVLLLIVLLRHLLSKETRQHVWSQQPEDGSPEDVDEIIEERSKSSSD